jgi:hypothetical protein
MGKRAKSNLNSLKAMHELVRLSYLPNLRNSTFTYESKATKNYNCAAWAIAIINKAISHDHPYNWDPKVPRTQHINSYIKYYENRGFGLCNSGKYEKGIEKIVLYSDEYKEWQHVAFQLNKKKWACKMGNWEDIYHNDVHCLCGGMYGSTLTYMSRKFTWKRKIKRLAKLWWIKILSMKS